LAAPKKVYWDSNVWLGFINDESGKADRCRHVLNEARLGNYEIWTSALTLAEVFKVSDEKGKPFPLPFNRDIEFENFVQQGFVVIVQVDADIGIDARRLLRKYQVLKKPADGVHLASALANSMDEMHTFDDVNLTPLSGLVNRADGVALKICFPPMPPTAELMEYPNAGSF
jgi:predicted nucleic acid-binding protein